MEAKNNFLQMVTDLKDFYVDEVKKFIEIYNYGKQQILQSSEDDYRLRLTDVPHVEGEKRHLLEEEEKILGELGKALDPRYFDEGSATKFFKEYYPNVKVKNKKIIYELNEQKYEIFSSPHGYWLKIYKNGEFITGRTFMMVYDLEKILQIIKMFSLFASERDCKKIDKIILTIDNLIKERSKDNIEKTSGLFTPLTSKIKKNFRKLRSMKEFYDILTNSTGGFNIKKFEKIDIDKFVDDLIKTRFGAEYLDVQEKDPAKIFDEKLKPELCKIIEGRSVTEREIEVAKKKVEIARNKIINFLTIEVDELSVEQIVKGVTNPYRAIEILEKMQQAKCESIIVDIQSFINLKNKDICYHIADLTEAGMKSKKKYVVDGFIEVGVKLIAAIKNSYKEDNYDLIMFYNICRILPINILREGFNREIGNDLMNLKEIEKRSNEMMKYYREYKDDAEDAAKDLFNEMQEDINNVLSQDIQLNIKLQQITEIASQKMAVKIKEKFPDIEGVFNEQNTGN